MLVTVSIQRLPDLRKPFSGTGILVAFLLFAGVLGLRVPTPIKIQLCVFFVIYHSESAAFCS